MKQGTWIVLIVILLLMALGAWWFMTNQQVAPPTTNGDVAGEEEEFVDNSKDGAAAEGVNSVTVNYSDQGFSPKTLTVPVGTRVTFVNLGASEMWVASDEHPSHTQYSGTNRESHCPDPAGVAFDQCGNGPTFTFTFTKAGTWSYHNHREDDHRGTIVVTE